jgi:hypothetical protein
VEQEEVGDAAQPRERVLVLVGDRLVGDVAARHHQRDADVGEQQVMQRRVREHHAELGRPRGDRRRHLQVEAPDDDRPRGRAQLRRPVDRAHHQRERPVLAVLARAQARDHLLVVRPAREVESADALDRDDRAVEQRAGGDLDARRDARAARRAGVRLRVEAPVGRVVVLGLAGRAHREARHRGRRPVVGHAGDDREARPAVGAVDERVAVAAVGGVEELGEAGVAGRGVGSDRGVGAPADARADAEPRLARVGDRLAGHRFDRRERRRVAVQPREEVVDRLALDLDEHAERVVEDEAREVELGRQPVHERAEADALHNSGHTRTDPHISSTSVWYAAAWASWMRGMCSERTTITWSASDSAAIRPPS